MGIWHLAGLGASPGAVTVGLSCVRQRYGTHSKEYGDSAEGLVLFTSPEVANGDMKCYPVVHNDIERITTRRTWTDNRNHVVEIIVEYMSREFPGTKVHLVETSVNDYPKCRDDIASVLLRLHPPGQVGKHIWGNMTGGTNILNVALTQLTYLSGFIARLYYTFLSRVQINGRYLQLFTDDPSELKYGEILPLKTNFGRRHRNVLDVLEVLADIPVSEYVSAAELLSQLKMDNPREFASTDEQQFRRDFLNVMQGIEREGNREVGQRDGVRISSEGREILKLMNQPLYRALVQHEPISDEARTTLSQQVTMKQLR